MAGATAFPSRDKEELAAILHEVNSISPLVCCMLEFSFRTGLRNVDLRKLEWDKLYINGVLRDKFTIVQSKPYNKRLTNGMKPDAAKKASEITISINGQLAALIETIHQLTGEFKLVFQSLNSRAKANSAITIQYVNRVLKRVAIKLGLPYQLSTHSMRKAFAKELKGMKAGMDDIMLRLGQSSLAATQHYMNTFDDESQDFVKNIEFTF